MDKYLKRFIDAFFLDTAYWQTMNKFLQGKAFEETDQLIVIADSYLLSNADTIYKESFDVVLKEIS